VAEPALERGETKVKHVRSLILTNHRRRKGGASGQKRGVAKSVYFGERDGEKAGRPAREEKTHFISLAKRAARPTKKVPSLGKNREKEKSQPRGFQPKETKNLGCSGVCTEPLFSTENYSEKGLPQNGKRIGGVRTRYQKKKSASSSLPLPQWEGSVIFRNTLNPRKGESKPFKIT